MCILSMSVMGFQKKVWMGWVGGVSSIQVFFLDFWNLFNFARPLDADREIAIFGHSPLL